MGGPVGLIPEKGSWIPGAVRRLRTFQEICSEVSRKGLGMSPEEADRYVEDFMAAVWKREREAVSWLCDEEEEEEEEVNFWEKWETGLWVMEEAEEIYHSSEDEYS